MKLSGIHLLLTYTCNLECDHCFVCSGPRQKGVMTLACVREILRQASDLVGVEWIYFEGGEPFLHYPVLVRGAQIAARHGFRVGIVSNGYWATDLDDAIEWLRPFRDLVHDLSISDDVYHGDGAPRPEAEHARAAASVLDIPAGVIRIAEPEATSAARAVGQLPHGESALLFRGRAADKLAPRADQRPWDEFTECPCEDLREPGRVHVDPFGNVHICQGILAGNVFRSSLAEICRSYDPDEHPVVGPLVNGGPAALARSAGVPHAECYADACHLCFEVRRAMRPRLADVLGPAQMYGTPS